MDMENNMKIYDSLPDGLATLATMEKELGINRRTIRTWIVRGHIPKRGLLRGAARRGGMILVSPRDVRELAESRSLLENGHSPRGACAPSLLRTPATFPQPSYRVRKWECRTEAVPLEAPFPVGRQPQRALMPSSPAAGCSGADAPARLHDPEPAEA